MPADAFFASGNWSGLSLSGPDTELALARNEDGFLSSFPFFYGGNFFPVTTRFDDRGLPAGFTVTSETPLGIDFLENGDPLPALVRVTGGETFYFVLIRYTDSLVLETWYDQEGGVLGVYSYRYEIIAGERRLTAAVLRSDGGEVPEEYAYDSLGNISAIRSPEGIFSALYTGGPRGVCPRYWRIPGAAAEKPAPVEGPPESGTDPAFDPGLSAAFITLQWDEEGLLVRLSGETGTSGEERTDRRYGYSRDERGNWTERRELSLIRRFGYLVPEEELVFERRIEYREGE
jgi:YD repeat-containing protein